MKARIEMTPTVYGNLDKALEDTRCPLAEFVKVLRCDAGNPKKLIVDLEINERWEQSKPCMEIGIDDLRPLFKILEIFPHLTSPVETSAIASRLQEIKTLSNIAEDDEHTRFSPAGWTTLKRIADLCDELHTLLYP